MKDLVSVIIPTIPNDPFIKDCVQSVNNSTYRPIEIIIVNEGKPRSEQRNIGISRATGKYFLFLDADQRVHPDLIKECVDKCNMGVSALYIPEEITTPGLFAKIRNFERSFMNATCVDCVRFVRAYKCPKFNTALNGPEDADFDRKMRGIRCLTHNPLFHQDMIGLIDYCRKKAYYSASMRHFSSLWPSDKCLDLKYRCFGVFVEKGKWKKLIRHPFLTIGIVFLLALRGVIYYAHR